MRTLPTSLAALAVALSASASIACDCGRTPPAAYFAAAGVIASGTVTKVYPTPKAGKDGFGSHTKVLLKVERAEKGATPGETLVMTVPPESSCDAGPPKKGERYAISGTWEGPAAEPWGGCPRIAEGEPISAIGARHAGRVAELTKLAEASGKAPDWDALGAYLLKMGDTRHADVPFAKAAKAEPGGKGRRFEIAQVHLANRDPKAAAKVLAGSADPREALLLAEARRRSRDYAPWPCEAGPKLLPADLRGGSLRDRNLEGLELKFLDLSGKDAGGASLAGTRMECVSLVGVSLKGANLEGLQLKNVMMEGADLEGAILEDARVERSVLSGVRARGLRARGADLSGIDLRGADLRGADLSKADISGSNLEGARFEGAILTGASYSCRTRLPDGTDVSVMKGPAEACPPRDPTGRFPFNDDGRGFRQ